MTQKDIVLEELIREPRGLTTIDLRERVPVPESSLRTVLWEMRKDGWIHVVGGVRGRYRYAATDDGREQAQNPMTDRRSTATSRHQTTTPLAVLPSIQPYITEQRRLYDFVRWLVLERPDLFADDMTTAREALERAVTTYIDMDADVIRRHIVAALQRADQ